MWLLFFENLTTYNTPIYPILNNMHALYLCKYNTLPIIIHNLIKNSTKNHVYPEIQKM